MNQPSTLVTVRLVDLPVEVHRRAGEHQEALRRELAFVEHAQAPDAVPARLKELSDRNAERYGSLNQGENDRLAAAIEARETRLDLELKLPVDVVGPTIQLGRLLDELDDLCRDGDLLTLVTPPDLLAYRGWLLGEIVAQIRDGADPTPWPGSTSDAPAAAEAPAAAPVERARVAVMDDLDLGTAGDLRNELAALTEAGVTHITVDLSGCDFVDSTGLSLLVTTHHRLVEGGGGLHLDGVNPLVRSLLDLAGASDFFDQA